MVLFGTKEMLISDGDDTEEKSCCVIELICDEISKDDLTFNNEQYRVIYEMFEKNLQENVLLTASHLKKLENQKIVSFVSNIESSEIELSHNWIQKYNIYTKSESDNIYKSVMNSVYNFKYHKVDELLAKVKKEIQESASGDEELLSLLGEQMSYERVKKKLSDKLGRIILK
jgi:DNA primase